MSSLPRYAYLGPEGTFTEIALRQMVPADAGEFVPVVDVPTALGAVRSGEVDYAVVAIENTVEGGVTATLDTLAEGSPLVILGEVVLPVSFELARHPASRLPTSLASAPTHTPGTRYDAGRTVTCPASASSPHPRMPPRR